MNDDIKLKCFYPRGTSSQYQSDKRLVGPLDMVIIKNRTLVQPVAHCLTD